MAEIKNDADNLGDVVEGFLFLAPVGTALPTKYDIDAATDLTGFTNVGFVSEDGIEDSQSDDSNDVVDMHGNVIYTTYSNTQRTIAFKPLEGSSIVAQMLYGKDNVTSVDGGIKVAHNGDWHSMFAGVYLGTLRNGARIVKTWEKLQTSEIDTLTTKNGEIEARQVTMKALAGADGKTNGYTYREIITAA